MTRLYKFQVKNPDGSITGLSTYKDQVILLVNTASKCGFTPQLDQLQTLYNKYKEKGFIVLGFPCDQFANQEYEDIEETLSFCQKNYNVSFPIFDKLDVNGAHEHPLFTFLKSEKSGILTKDIKWNFTKFLIDRKGHVVKRFAPTTKIEKIEKLMRHYL